MGATILYKYLDAKGGLAMLTNSNLQFTNATKFNDPFDCHPALFDYSNPPTNENNWPPADFLKLKGETDMENLRKSTWICCLSKVYDSLLMWSYYNSHKGICIGLNKDATIKSCYHGYVGLLLPFAAEVKYKDIHQKPDYFKSDAWASLLTIKAKEWEHEQEVRLITKDPAWLQDVRDIPDEFSHEKDCGWEAVRYYPSLAKECFDSVYLGVNILSSKKKKVIEAARRLNPEIKIYQMRIDPEAFKLKEERIDF